jgi:hypothetical protein
LRERSNRRVGASSGETPVSANPRATAIDACGDDSVREALEAVVLDQNRVQSR